MAHEKLSLVAAVDPAHVHMPIVEKFATHTHCKAVIFHGAAEARHKAAGEAGDERFAVGICLHRGNVLGAGYIIDNPDGRAGAAHAGAVQVSHLDGVVGLAVYGDFVTVKDTAARVWITKVETSFDLALGIVAVAVSLEVVTDIDTDVAKEFVVVFKLRRAPDHHVGMEHTVVVGVWNIWITGINQPLRVRTLLGAVGGIGFLVLEAQVGKAVAAQRQADVCRKR